MSSDNQNQWLFSLLDLENTPSTCSLEKEMYDRARGVEFLFRLGSSLVLPTTAMCTAATWFHRFYMRFSMDDFHRQDVAASCIFLATKTEECGRKLRDVARVYQAKVKHVDVNQIPAECQEVDRIQTAILHTEEVLLEALCFDFVAETPHAELLSLFDACATDPEVQESAWSLAHDSYRTPMCILYPPRIIATACLVLAQRIQDGPNSPSLDARISGSAGSKSLPTPPSHKPPSPDASRAAVDYYAFDDQELSQLSEALGILLEFYSVQDMEIYPWLSPVVNVPPPAQRVHRIILYVHPSHFTSGHGQPTTQSHSQPPNESGLGRTPSSTHGGHSPSTVG